MRYLMNRLAAAMLPSYAGRHRGTPGQLMLQNAQRAKRWSNWAEWMTTPDSEKAGAQL